MKKSASRRKYFPRARTELAALLDHYMSIINIWSEACRSKCHRSCDASYFGTQNTGLEKIQKMVAHNFEIVVVQNVQSSQVKSLQCCNWGTWTGGFGSSGGKAISGAHGRGKIKLAHFTVQNMDNRRKSPDIIVTAPNFQADEAYKLCLLLSASLVVHRTLIHSGLIISRHKKNFSHEFWNHEIVDIILVATKKLRYLCGYRIHVYNLMVRWS